jgi:hypothetical protein
MNLDERINHAIYANIFDSLTGRGPAGQGRVFLSLTGKGGIPIDPKKYHEADKPGSAGSHAYALLVDEAPVLSSSWEPSGQSVEKLYGQLLTANVKPPPANNAEGSAASVFSGAQAAFAKSTLRAPHGAEYHASAAVPANWFLSDTKREFTSVDIDMDKVKLGEEHSSMTAGGDGGLDLGFFSISGSGGVSEKRSHLHTETRSVKIAFEYMRVEILRPWLDLSLFSFTDYSLNGRPKGYFSTGKADGKNHGVLPLLPTVFIVARNLVVSAEWSAEDLETVHKVVNGGGGFSFFGISVGGGASTSSSSTKISHEGKVTTIKHSGEQIIGFVSVIMPESPTLAG